MQAERQPNPKAFPDTRWSLIDAIRRAGRDSDAAGPALEEICRAYWQPVYVFIRREGRGADDAEDLTQGFFEYLLGGSFFERSDPERGRLRNYTLGALKNYLAAEHVRTNARKRGGGVIFEPVDAGRLVDDAASPDEAFERQWAADLLRATLQQLRAEYTAKGRGDWFETLTGFLSSPERGDAIRAATSLGVSRNAALIAIHRLRKRYRLLIRDEIRRTLAPGGDVEEELRYLASLLQSG